MSQENLEIVRSMYRPGDPTRFFDVLDEEVEVDVSGAPLLPDQPELTRGKGAAIDLYRHYWGTWAEYILEPVEIIDAGNDDVVVVQQEEGQGKGSGVPFERRWALIYTLINGKITRIRHYATEQHALQAAGLSE